MLLRLFWRNCDYYRIQEKKQRIDAFWLETTLHEAERFIFPFLAEGDVTKSRELASRYQWAAEKIMGQPDRPFCFLVARNLSYIFPEAPHYPVHHMWNAYSPFELMKPEVTANSLEELKSLPLPPMADSEDRQTKRQEGDLT